MRADLRLFSGSDDGCVRQWDVRSGRSVLTLDAADGSRVTAMELGTPADPMVVTGSSGGVRRDMWLMCSTFMFSSYHHFHFTSYFIFWSFSFIVYLLFLHILRVTYLHALHIFISITSRRFYVCGTAGMPTARSSCCLDTRTAWRACSGILQRFVNACACLLVVVLAQTFPSKGKSFSHDKSFHMCNG